MSFVNLHCHTVFSMKDAIGKPEALATRAKEMGQEALAITDHGHMAGAVKFTQACQEVGIKPILGMEGYLAVGDPYPYDEDGNIIRVQSPNLLTPEAKQLLDFHIVLLVKDHIGYQNLAYLNSKAHIYGFYGHPRICLQDLLEHSEGLILMTACASGYVYKAVAESLKGRSTLRGPATYLTKRFKEAFGDDFYIEILYVGHNCHVPGTKETIPEPIINQSIAKFADQFQVKLAATGDCHYVLAEHKFAHDVLQCDTKNRFAIEPNPKKYQGHFHLKSREEMEQGIPRRDAIDNTVEIARKCSFLLTKTVVSVPKLPNIENPAQTLEELARNGIAQAWPHAKPDMLERIKKQIEYELKVIHDLNFDNYFLIAWDVVKWARNNDILVGDGRGSGASSRVARALNIVTADPEEYNLYFERFLNPDRKSAPDFDIDFQTNRQEDVFQYIRDVFGEGHVCRIGTTQSYKPRGLANHVFPILANLKDGCPPEEKESWDDPYISLRSKIGFQYDKDPSQTVEEVFKADPQLANAIASNPDFREKYYNAMVELEGCRHTWSTHAAGVVISGDPLLLTHPLRYLRDKDEINTQYDKDDVEYAGLLKLDCLAVKTLDVVDAACKIIKITQGKDIDIHKLDLHDGRVYKYLGTTEEREELFQISTPGIGGLTHKAKPESIREIADLIALYRPGPLDAKDPVTGKNMVDMYIDRKAGIEPLSFLVPQLKNVLGETYGVIVFQEQIIQIARELCGWTALKADHLRYAIAKKKRDQLPALQEEFVRDCKKVTGCDDNAVNTLWSQIETFGRYGFNKAHSVSYAYLAYKTAYLKSIYPTEYLCAMMNIWIRDKQRIGKHISEARIMGIKVVPPDVNACHAMCTVEPPNTIRIGTAGIKGLDAEAAEAVEKTKEFGPFESFVDFVVAYRGRTMAKAAFKVLAKIGFFDSLAIPPGQTEVNRNWILDNIEDVTRKIGNVRKRKKTDEEKAELMQYIDMPEKPQRPFLEEHRDETYHLGFILREDCPIVRYHGEEVKHLLKMGCVSIADAIKIHKGEDSRKAKWEFVAVPCLLYTNIADNTDLPMMEDKETFCAVKVASKYAKSNMHKMLSNAIADGEPRVVLGKIDTNRSKKRFEFRIVDMKKFSEVDTTEEFRRFSDRTKRSRWNK